MRILILGGLGMLGHRLWIELQADHEVWATVRKDAASVPNLHGVNRARILGQVDAMRFETVAEAFSASKPEVVINCIGLIKQRENAQKASDAIRLNALFPHQVAELCQTWGSRLIHISTDCVFSGTKGFYSEGDPADAYDVYGKSKALGEIEDKPFCLTLRTSIIGRELATHFGLVEWFLSQTVSVKGYQRAIFSGFPTTTLAHLLRDYVLPNADLHGLYHVSTEPIAKYDLLQLLKQGYKHPVEIIPDSNVVIDRSLNSDHFRKATGFQPLPWAVMIEAMVANEERNLYALARR